jgi:hypothetical protein
MKRAVFVGLGGGAVAVFVLAPAAGAATAPDLGSAQSFAVLAGTTITNTGATTVNGDAGLSPGSAVSDLGTLTVTGATHTADAVALQAQNDVIGAYSDLTDAPCTQSFTGTSVEVGAQTLTPGVYCYSSSAQLTGTLTLDGDGVYIFKAVSTLTTAVGASVALIGGAQPCSVFWQVGSSADLFTNTSFVGTIVALTSINLQSGTDVAGRVLARNGAVTMDTNTVTASICAAAATPTATTAAATSTATIAPVTPTATSGSGAPTATINPATATPPPETATVTTGAPPASPVQPPGSAAPPRLPRLPNTGGAPPPRGTSAHWLLALMTAIIGSLALGQGVRTYGRRTR